MSTPASTTASPHQTSAVVLGYRQRIADVADPVAPNLGRAIDQALVTLVAGAALSGHLPAQKPRVRVIHRGHPDWQENAWRGSHSVLVVELLIRCAHRSAVAADS